jgi:predicted regulator of Ras-like GTPase activity (Roadblock/LC7/MglB family)
VTDFISIHGLNGALVVNAFSKLINGERRCSYENEVVSDFTAAVHA